MRSRIDKVEIQEPPLTELKKKRSCAKRTCCTGCGCIILFLIAAAAVAYIIISPSAKTLDAVPEHFPKDIPVYDDKSISRITYISGADAARRWEMLRSIPEQVMDRILRRSADQQISENTLSDAAAALDTTMIEWSRLPASPDFLLTFYAGELRKGGYTVLQRQQTGGAILSFEKGEDAYGKVSIFDDASKSGTDRMTITVSYRAKE